ncbi:hypothetical protein CDL15_Pgr008098 [Punica granatum]|uniref:B box-type domain-containing protein n=1 Tax=Punica granatum TaxID=22663 RepID=A0A218W321_PUNGR|nr:hypothetical protein CDL15_Pgr008098 [Punica granatum]
MKIQCDVCERAPATVICCADEAALCSKCDFEVHAANKLASKHQRLLLQCLSNYKLPRCDICQEKAALIFCVEDRALFCQDCDESIHSAHSLSANHQRFLATGIRVALSSKCTSGSQKGPFEPPSQNTPQNPMKTPKPQQASLSTGWSVDELLQLSELESSEKKDQLGFGELEWLADVGLFGEQSTHHQETLTAAEVPQLPVSQPSSFPAPNCRTNKFTVSAQKKPRIDIAEDDDDDDEHFTVPDLGLD